MYLKMTTGKLRPRHFRMAFYLLPTVQWGNVVIGTYSYAIWTYPLAYSSYAKTITADAGAGCYSFGCDSTLSLKSAKVYCSVHSDAAASCNIISVGC